MGPCNDAMCSKLCKNCYHVFNYWTGPVCECLQKLPGDEEECGGGGGGGNEDPQCLDGKPFGTKGVAAVIEPVEDQCFTVLDNTGSAAGAVWSCTKIDISSGFNLKVNMYFGDKNEDGGDGMIFTLQTQGFDALGAPSSESGDNGITPRFGVLFRTWIGDGEPDTIGFLSNCAESFCGLSPEQNIGLE
jgi:Bacterial lectin